MASTLTNEDIRELRRWAKQAEPYPYDHELFRTFDMPRTPEQQERIDATMARFALEQAGVPLDEE